MSTVAKILSLSYDSAEVTKTSALRTYFRSVRLIKDTNELSPTAPPAASHVYSILLNGNCMDQENRKLYTFYLDTFYNQAWIFEIDVDTRKQSVVFFDATNRIGFDGAYKIYNPRVVQGKLIWTDNKNPEYQMDIKRAKASFIYNIGYGQYPVVTEWNSDTEYLVGMIVWRARNFYRCLIQESNADPIVWPEYWEKICLIEEAYYSTDPTNFYFAPIPPKFNPVVEYISDSDRKPNNLRQNLWQFAYRYVYMDYRKSTFSPACIPDMPDSEEEIATGLANELSELNNAIKIRINTGGEEVRKIEIIGRSTQDPATWYLVEVIDLFDELEGTEYKSSNPISEPLKGKIGISIKQPKFVNISIAEAVKVGLGISIPNPTPWNVWLEASDDDMEWDAIDHDVGVGINSIITAHGGVLIELISKPDWISIIRVADSSPVEIGNASVASGATIKIFPNSENTGLGRMYQEVIFQDDSGYENTVTILVSQLASIINPSAGVYVLAECTWMTVTEDSGSATIGSPLVNIIFTPHNTHYNDMVDFTTDYMILKDGVTVAEGSFTVRNNQSKSIQLTMNSNAEAADTIIVVIWEGIIL